jgi:cobyric acid synthase CobQ/L-threonine-O-3-phosphate decarboxylase
MMERHGGHLQRAAQQCGLAPGELLDFSANINPLGFPEWLRPLISSQIEMLCHYPEPGAGSLVSAIAAANEVAEENVVVGNGASELLALLPHLLPVKRLLLPVPCYVDYRSDAEQAGLEVVPVPLQEEDDFRFDPQSLESQLKEGDLVIFGQPNNPTGQLVEPDVLLDLIRRNPQTYFISDESFIDFCAVEEHSLRSQRPENLLIIHSLTKSWAIPGLRLGYALAAAEITEKLRNRISPWSVNSLAQAVGIRAMADANFLVESRSYVAQLRKQLSERLQRIAGIKVYPGEANFLLLRLCHPTQTAASLAAMLLKQGLLIRRCSNFEGLDDSYLRIAVRTEQENDSLCRALEKILQGKMPRSKACKTPAIMFQGTGSNAGKSILTAALCRILQQDGVNVAPFKSQNMSLNSSVTFSGGEMGRAQVLQAQACRLDPDVRMNPILLKPCSATGSQVILKGEVLETMHFRDYAERREAIFAEVKDCYNSLAAEHQVMVLEGAGSPAEINLKKRDIVNMNMARYADADVLLVGDIDRGGVFASFVGTLELLSEWERQRIAGFVINRFRGDASLLDEALVKTSLHSGKPFFGTVPYLPNLGLPEEDSVDFKEGLLETVRPSGDVLDIALIDLPHISNFTDFDALRIEEDLHLRKVTDPRELGSPDALILPGSKNVINDLGFLNDTGFAVAIQRLAEQGTTEIVGICGGYQLLGKRISDPHGVESARLDVDGLGVLDLNTELAAQKTTTSCKAIHLLSGENLHGYEIHHGISRGAAVKPLIERLDGEVLGHVATNSELVWGTYLHGLFDADAFRRWFLDRLRVRRGWQPLEGNAAIYDLEPALDRLADHVRVHLDMEQIYRMLKL